MLQYSSKQPVGSGAETMFKKLKQKIEEGGDGGIEKISFTPKKFPGSAVRTLSQNDEEGTVSQPVEESPATIEREQSCDEQQGVVINDLENPVITNVDMVSVCCYFRISYLGTNT